jgi:hypothetical protein
MSSACNGAQPRLPRWGARGSSFLAAAAQQIRLIAANTPSNFREELERLRSAWRRGEASAPRFVYAPCPRHTELRRALVDIAKRLDAEGALGAIYAARARELDEEAAICEQAGGPGLFHAARRRYARRDEFDALADALATSWLDEGEGEGEEPVALACVRSDDERDPASLLCRLREEIGRRKLPMRLLVSANIASLAATGDGFVQIVADRWLSPRDVERTVMHEIEGHVLPRLASARVRLGIFAVGTARGSDDQEGRALALEREGGYLDHGRRRELALRHVAARQVESGADFATTTRCLLRVGAPLDNALRIAARAHRGGGLARESVYLPALLRVEAAVTADASVDTVLRAGRVSIDAVRALRDFAEID